MISVNEAKRIITSKCKDFGTEFRPLISAKGHVLREDIYTDRPLPPYDRVTMDGIAINFASYSEGLRSFKIEGVAAAGDPQHTLYENHFCLEAMTGAVLPKGTDTIIRYEDLVIEGGEATIQIDTITKGQNIHYKGEDRKANELVISQGEEITQAEIGLAASVGHENILVSKKPSIAIISTGDELVDINQQPLPHQIRRSNVFMVRSSLEDYLSEAKTFHITDDLDVLRTRVKTYIDEFDVIILSGGVSKGKFDYLPQVLTELEVMKLFHKIKQRPGKPFWFGEAKDGTLVFALPGNPVSSFMCTHNYIIPWLRKTLKINEQNQPFAILQKTIEFTPDLCYYPIVNIKSNALGELEAYPVNNNGSGDFASLIDGNAFLELARGKNIYEKGECFRALLYR